MFGTGVKQLDRLQASGLIDELLDRHGGGWRNKRPYRKEGAALLQRARDAAPEVT
jgi:hypothetical protein